MSGTIIVVGRARIEARPDRAVARLAISEVAPQPATALDSVAQRTHGLVQVLAELGVGSDAWSTDGVQLHEEVQHAQGERTVIGHRATTTVSVTMTDLAKVSALVREAVERAGARIDGLDWTVDAANPIRRELLAAAARDARERAAVYADALGVQLGAVDVVSERPLDAGPEPRPLARMAMAAPVADLPVNPGAVELSAEVHVRFHLLP